jgi:membrane fusion protein (multidrug efflux system)
MTIKNVFFTVLGIILVIAAIVSVKGLQILTLIEVGKAVQEPPTTISAEKVQAYEWESTLTAIGSLEAAKGLEVTADLSGRIIKILFDAGSEVEVGDLLVEQDISTENAQLRAAKSAAALAKNNFSRIRQLYKRKVASKSEYDSSQNAYQLALAEVDNIAAAIEKKSIRAPFKGRLGIRLIDLGQSISAGEPLVSLQATDQMFVNFFLPQQNLSQLAVGLTIRLTSDAVPDTLFTGKINAINPEIDSKTRSVEIQAILANPENTLLPGMFANIEVVLPKAENVLLIPITSVKYATYGDSVFVVDTQVEPKVELQVESESIIDDNDTEAVKNVASETTEATSDNAEANPVATSTDKPATEQLIVRQQFVRLGETRGDYVAVTKGLSENEMVVNAGVFKLRNGGPVVINNDVVPEFSLNPILEDQ